MSLSIPVVMLFVALQVPGATPEVSPAPEARVPDTFGSGDIRDWYAPDNRTLIISTYSHGSFKGEFMNACQGIRFAETLGFATRGPYQLDSSTHVVLPGGERCAFKSLVPIDRDEERRLRKRSP